MLASEDDNINGTISQALHIRCLKKKLILLASSFKGNKANKRKGRFKRKINQEVCSLSKKPQIENIAKVSVIQTTEGGYCLRLPAKQNVNSGIFAKLVTSLLLITKRIYRIGLVFLLKTFFVS